MIPAAQRIELSLAVVVNTRILASNRDFKKDARDAICAEWNENADGDQLPGDLTKDFVLVS